MGQDHVVKLLRSKPFVPFRLYLSNDERFDIRHPDMAIATPWTIHVGVPPSTISKDAAGGVVIVSLNHVLKIEFLASLTAAASDGPSK